MRYLHLIYCILTSVCCLDSSCSKKISCVYFSKYVLIPKVKSKYRIRTKDFDVSNFVHTTNDCTIPILSPLDLLAITADENIHI